MQGLQVNMKKKPTGEWDELVLQFGDNVASVKILATSPFVLRFLVNAPQEIKVERK